MSLLAEDFPSYEERPVEREDEPGKWDALDANGYGHVLGYDSEDLVWTWLDGYATGARENM